MTLPKLSALVVVVLVACSCSQASPIASRTALTRPLSLSGTIGKASYEIQVPADWEGTLFLYSHGSVAPGGPNVARDADDPERDWLLTNHYAIAGSSYSSTGWAVQDAFKDQIALLDYFSARVAKPTRVIAWGLSLGGLITSGLVQLYPERFAAAMPLCGLVAGGVALWNTFLDAAYAFKTLLAPKSALQVVHITNPTADGVLAQQIFQQATTTPQGRARLALVAALSDIPGWFDPAQAEPAPTDYGSWLGAQESWLSNGVFVVAFTWRTELERRAAGNPSWNVGVDYAQRLATSTDAQEVQALYRQAGLNLLADLQDLNSGPRISADQQAFDYLARYFSPDGTLRVPVLTIHTTGDGLVVPPTENAYAEVVSRAGSSKLLRQLFVHRAGHCAFTAAEVIAGWQVLLRRIDTGHWDDEALQPATLDLTAAGQGAALNAYPPAFVTYEPAQYPRPFAKGSSTPT